jgi:hypothetical protein
VCRGRPRPPSAAKQISFGVGNQAAEQCLCKNQAALRMDGTAVAGGGILGRERITAKPGFNRWLVPPAALAIHLCIGSVRGGAIVGHGAAAFPVQICRSSSLWVIMASNVVTLMPIRDFLDASHHVSPIK